MSWDHTGHDRRRGHEARTYPFDLNDNRYWDYVCLDCREVGQTSQDISDWPEFNSSDYERHMEWLDPEVYAWRNNGA